jgi:hypothetical protein
MIIENKALEKIKGFVFYNFSGELKVSVLLLPMSLHKKPLSMRV